MGRQEQLKAKNTPIDGKRFIFSLSDRDNDLTLTHAPDGWAKDEYQLIRDMSYFGVFRKFTVGEMQFVKEGRDFIKTSYDNIGVNSDCTFKVEEYNSNGILSTRFIGKVDFSTFQETELSCNVQIKDGTFTDLLLTRKSVEVDLLSRFLVDSVETVGQELATMIDVYLTEIKIVEVASWKEHDSTAILDENHSLQVDIVSAEFDEAKTTAGLLFGKFFDTAIEDYTTAELKFQIEAEANGSTPSAHFTWSFHIDRWSGGVLSEADLWSDSFESVGTFPMSISIDDSFTFDISTGDSLVFRAEITNDIGTGDIKYSLINIKLTCPISTVPERYFKAFLYHEAFTYLIRLLTGKNNAFYSNALGRIDLGYLADGHKGVITAGKYLRTNWGLNSSVVVSFENLFKSLQSIYCLGMGIENDKVVIEDMAYFFDDNIILDISNRIAPETITREYYPELAFNRISVGYNSFDYETLGGIYEYNTTSKYTTRIRPVDRELNIVSPYRADMSGVLKLLQEPAENKDIQGENDIFILDSLKNQIEYFVNTQMSYEYADNLGNTDIYINLDITPAKNLRRWGAYVRGCLEKDLDSYVMFQSSGKNTKLITKDVGYDPIAENANILVSELSNPLWHPEIFRLEVPALETDIEVIQANQYGIIKITDSEYGWILSYRSKNENKMSEYILLRCNTDYVTPGGTPPVYPADLKITKVITDRPTDAAKFLVNVVGDNGVEYTNLVLIQGIGITLQNVPYGTYTITEVVLPNGYVNTSIIPDEVIVDSQNLHGEVEITNVYLGVPEVIKYGALYHHFAVNDSRGIARSGFEVPNRAKYQTLITYIGSNPGYHLRESGTVYWDAPNTGADNSFNFNGRGSGFRLNTGVFQGLKGNGRYFASIPIFFPPTYNEFMALDYSSSTALIGSNSTYTGTALRLVRATTTPESLLADGTACNPYFDGEYFYRTVKIGTQVWTADNIKTRYYANSFKVEYGSLYNVYAGLDSRKISSSDDWDIPTKTQLETMQSFLGGSSVAGGKMRDSNLNYWTDITGVTNSSKFNGRGAGYRGSSFLRLYGDNHLMTRTLNYDTYYYIGILSSGSLAFSTTAYSYAYAGRSIRLIKATTSLTDGQTGTYTGNDGKVYRTICIGTQEWLADDLCETKYRNGDTIPIVTDQTTWNGLTTGAMCHYNNTESNSFINDNVIPVVTDNSAWSALTTGAMCSYNNDDSNL